MTTKHRQQPTSDRARQVTTYHCDQCGHEVQVDAPRPGSKAPTCCGHEMKKKSHAAKH